ncbi:hypothetical protein [Pseudophaeobacter leonis]|uniref:hypothetical protein n=1 Tax=Pseudophaeobacter leonis TaxID=1144477 RepID=UPI001F4DD43D|nr:hypothetical protein [Pseudophaeobacter leonis]
MEGPDLHANYRPSVLEGDADQDVAVSVSFSNPGPTAEAVQKPKLQDYVSEDYAVPGIGAQSYGVSSSDAAFGAQGFAAQSYPDQNFADQTYADQEYEAANDAYQNTAATASQGLAYGAAQQHSYGYEAEPTEDYGYDDTSYPAPLARSGVARAASLLGAVASLAIVVGIGAGDIVW